jgi:hypothetical protein
MVATATQFTPHALKCAGYRLVIVTMNGKSFMCHAPVMPDGRVILPIAWIQEQLGIPPGACLRPGY